MLMGTRKEGRINRMAAVLGLVALVLAGAVRLPAQNSVEARLAALEARIQQLESELAAARGMTSQPVAVPVSASGSKLEGAFPRPAVLTSPATMAMASTAAAAPTTAMAPPLQAGTPDFSGDYEGLNFFKGVKFGGFIDAYYGYDFNTPPSGKVTYRNFDFNHNSLTLSQVDFEMTKATGEASPLGYNVQMSFGPTADWVNSGDPGVGNSTGAHFMQYYLSWRANVGRGLTLDFGKFVTQHGAEVIDTRADWNYSRGILFAWAIPYHHFGARATLPLSDKVTLAAFLVNGWNNVVDNNSGKTGGFQFIFNSGPFSFIQNYMVGPEQTGASDKRHLLDSLLTLKAGDKVTFMANYDYGMDRTSDGHAHWQGIAGYVKLQPTSWFALTPRIEYFADTHGFATGTAQKMKEFTITPEFTLSDNLVTRFEYRHDWSDAESFEVSDPTDDATKQDTAAVGLILKF